MQAIRRTRIPGKIDPNVRSALIPLSVDDCILWLDATQITGLSDNDDLATWSDLSGNNLDVSEATNKPKYRTSGINSLPSVQFGINASTKLTSTGFPTVTNTSVFIVYRLTSYPVPYSTAFCQNNINTGIMHIHSNGGVVYWRNPLGNEVDDSGYALNTTYIYLLRHDGTGIEAWMDGVQETSGGSAATEKSKTVMVGNHSDNVGRIGGYIGEIIWYSRALNSGEVTLINNYLAAKWQ